MLNTEENRQKFANQFYCKHPDGPYEVNKRTANKILNFLDRYPEEIDTPNKLWSFIMQDRVSYMLGEIHIIALRKQGKRVTDKMYAETGKKVVSDILEFVKFNLKGK